MLLISTAQNLLWPAGVPVDVKLKRRKRFQWTSEDDELARDTYIILNSRCRSHHRIVWSAAKQVFPSIRRDSVRTRMYILEKQPGAKQYLQRLENCWHELWMKHRGSTELPDKYPNDPTNFDLMAHVAFLRKYIDKNALSGFFLIVTILYLTSIIIGALVYPMMGNRRL